MALQSLEFRISIELRYSFGLELYLFYLNKVANDYVTYLNLWLPEMCSLHKFFVADLTTIVRKWSYYF